MLLNDAQAFAKAQQGSMPDLLAQAPSCPTHKTARPKRTQALVQTLRSCFVICLGPDHWLFDDVKRVGGSLKTLGE